MATSRSGDAAEREQAVLDQAAEQLGVEPGELRDALGAAQDSQLDAEVAAGRITQEQAERIQQARDRSGLVLGGGGPGPGHHRGGPGGPGGGASVDAAAKALGLPRAQLLERLRDGRTLEAIATAQGKDLADVKAAIRTAVESELDAAVRDGDLTRAQAGELLEHLEEHLDEGRFFGPGRGRGFDGPRP